ncbi:MAG: hypothetical protein CMJ23_12190 [Phycisphaerae bacterium]|nr:hypothetical protein [Phycisphaerae bacterium]
MKPRLRPVRRLIIPAVMSTFFVLASAEIMASPPMPASLERASEANPASPKSQEPPARRRGRSFSDKDLESIIEVAEDISPEWASSLRKRLADDPDNARSDFRMYGRRLFGLLMLKRQNPDLYTIRVAELALKKGITDRATEYHLALQSDASKAEVIAEQLREMVKESVDLELRARAMELEALDLAVRDLRNRLLGEVNEREVRVETLWKALLDKSGLEDGRNDPFGGLGGLDGRKGSRPGVGWRGPGRSSPEIDGDRG